MIPIITHFNLFATSGCIKPKFLGLEPWYQYLSLSGNPPNCSVNFSSDPTKILGGGSPFLLVGLAILDDLIRIAALVAVGYVIYGGIQYVTSQGSPDSTKKARETLVNALIGLGVAIIATSIVSFIGSKLGNIQS